MLFRSRIATDRGEYTAFRVVLAAGAGAVELLPADVTHLLTVSRQVQYWFETQGHDDLPVWIWELQGRGHGIYGFPSRGGAAKIATESFAGEIPPDEVYRSLIAPHLEGLSGHCVKAMPCLYTATPDFHFLIDRHPAMDRVIVASPCSGHGFKHSAAIGEEIGRAHV